MNEGVKRLRRLAKAVGVIVATLVAALSVLHPPMNFGLPEVLGVAGIWGFLTWGLIALVAWIIEGFQKSSNAP